MVQSINDGSNNIKLLQYIVSVSQETFNSSKQKYPQNRCLINIKQSNSSHKSDSQSLGQVPTTNITVEGKTRDNRERTEMQITND
jgi:hypothetical protein